MATKEITISELELADEVLADMTLPVDTAMETRAVTLKQLRAWLGPSLPTGFIIPAVGKISDERFTLLDGKTLSRAGTYEAFCNKVVSEVQAGNWFACSEDEYNSDISNYGQCGKFVVSNDYIRIPTITRFIGATVTLSEIGKTYKESLPNINGEFRGTNAWNGNGPERQTGALYSKGNLSKVNGSQQAGHNTYSLNFDASRSSSTYQDGAKVQPDHTKYPYYMVISTEGQTAEVGIDINQVYEDMNLKANSDLSNVASIASSFKEQSVGWGMPDYSAKIEVPWDTEVTRIYPCFVNVFPNATVRGNVAKITINNVVISIYNEGGESGSIGSGQFFIPANTPYKVSGGYENNGTIYEFPLQGVN